LKTTLFFAIALAALSVAGAKSYELSFDQPAMAGSVEVPRGHYSVSVDASTVRFKDLGTGKSISAPAKVEKVEKKFDATSTTLSGQNGKQLIKEIDLGGTTTKLEFE
jgi:hypothetical protein